MAAAPPPGPPSLFPRTVSFQPNGGVELDAVSKYDIDEDDDNLSIGPLAPRHNGGMVVAWLEPDSTAAAASLMIGDRILTVQGHESTELDMSEISALISGSSGQKLHLTVIHSPKLATLLYKQVKKRKKKSKNKSKNSQQSSTITLAPGNEQISNQSDPGVPSIPVPPPAPSLHSPSPTIPAIDPSIHSPATTVTGNISTTTIQRTSLPEPPIAESPPEAEDNDDAQSVESADDDHLKPFSWRESGIGQAEAIERMKLRREQLLSYDLSTESGERLIEWNALIVDLDLALRIVLGVEPKVPESRPGPQGPQFASTAVNTDPVPAFQIGLSLNRESDEKGSSEVEHLQSVNAKLVSRVEDLWSCLEVFKADDLANTHIRMREELRAKEEEIGKLRKEAENNLADANSVIKQLKLKLARRTSIAVEKVQELVDAMEEKDTAIKVLSAHVSRANSRSASPMLVSSTRQSTGQIDKLNVDEDGTDEEDESSSISSHDHSGKETDPVSKSKIFNDPMNQTSMNSTNIGKGKPGDAVGNESNKGVTLERIPSPLHEEHSSIPASEGQSTDLNFQDAASGVCSDTSETIKSNQEFEEAVGNISANSEAEASDEIIKADQESEAAAEEPQSQSSTDLISSEASIISAIPTEKLYTSTENGELKYSDDESDNNERELNRDHASNPTNQLIQESSSVPLLNESSEKPPVMKSNSHDVNSNANDQFRDLRKRLDEMERTYVKEALQDWTDENPGVDPETSEDWKDEMTCVLEEFQEDVRLPAEAELLAKLSNVPKNQTVVKPIIVHKPKIHSIAKPASPINVSTSVASAVKPSKPNNSAAIISKKSETQVDSSNATVVTAENVHQPENLVAKYFRKRVDSDDEEEEEDDWD